MAQPTVVYVLTAEGRDLYSATTRVSIASLRTTNPDCRVVLVCDPVTDAGVSRDSDPIRSEVDVWMVVDTPEGTPTLRNRYLKSRLRIELDGPFLYLDGDTVIRGDLEPIFSVTTDIAGAPNHSTDLVSDQIWDGDIETSRLMGWTVGQRAYVNGGVLYFADTPGSRRFGSTYHEMWLSSVERTGESRDQPALNAAIGLARPSLTSLSHRYNAQYRTNLSVARDAVILHYYISDPGPPSAAELLARRTLEETALEHRDVEKLLRAKHPWRNESPIDDWIASRVLRKGRMNTADTLWFKGERVKSCRDRIGSAIAGAAAAFRPR